VRFGGLPLADLMAFCSPWSTPIGLRLAKLSDESYRPESVVVVSAKHMKKSSRRSAVPSQGRAKLAKLRRITDAEIARSSPQELRDLPHDFWDGAVPVFPAAKVPISLRVDSDVLEFFRETGPRYQSRMNAVLRSYMERISTAGRKQRKKRGIA
jgi:uncharacterized protein (DUF4415 family)